MRIYEFLGHREYASEVLPADAREFSKLGLIAAPPKPDIEQNWQPVELYIRNPLLKPADVFIYGYYLFFRAAAAKELQDCIGTDATLLPVIIEDIPDEIVMLYPVNVVDAIDREEIKRRKTSSSRVGNAIRVSTRGLHETATIPR
jgi:hypothetical protein